MDKKKITKKSLMIFEMCFYEYNNPFFMIGIC
jgi:hypothetical protein